MEKTILPPATAAWGEPIQTYREKGRGCVMIGLILAAIYGLGFVIGGAVTLFTADSPGASIGAVFTGLVLIVPCLWAYNRKKKYDPTQVQGFEDGLVFEMGKKTIAARWEEIAAIHENLHSMRSLDSITLHAQTPHVRVYLRDGQLFSINLLGDGKPMGDLIRGKTCAVIEKAVLDCINAGQPAAFGDITLSPAGVQYQQKSLSWNQVVMQVKEDKCEIWDKTSSRWDRFLIRLPAEKLPNLVALFGIMEHYQKQAKAAAQAQA